MLLLINRLLIAFLFLLTPHIAVQAAQPRTDTHGDPLPAAALARLGSARFRLATLYDRGFPSLPPAAISPDGKLFALNPDFFDCIVLLDAAKGRYVRQWRVKPGYRVLNFTFSPDSKKLAVEFIHQVILFDVASGKQLACLENPGPIEGGGLVFSADGRRLTVAKPGGQWPKKAIPVWDVASGKKIASLEIMHTYRPRVALSADGKLLASWGGTLRSDRNTQMGQLNNIVQLWDVDAGWKLRQIECESLVVSAADLAPDGKRLATVDRDGTTVSLWDTSTGARLRQFMARNGSSALLRFFPDGKRLVACDDLGVTQVWDIASGKRLGVDYGPKCRPVASAALANGQMLLAGLAEQTVHLWEAPSGRRRTSTDGHTSSVRAVTFSPDGRTIISVAYDGVCLWDAATGKLLRHDPHREMILGRKRHPITRQSKRGYLLSPNGRFLIDRATTAGARVLDRASGDEICALEAVGTYGAWGEAIPAAFAADSRTFASLGWIDRKGILNIRLRIWDVSTGEAIRTLRLFTDENHEYSVALSPDSRMVACACNFYGSGNNPPHYQIGLWSIASGKEIRKITGVGGTVMTTAFSPDGTLLATGGESEPVRLWDVSDGTELYTLEEQPKAIVTNVVFSPDGRLVAAALTDRRRESGRVLLWERITGQLRAEFVGHRGLISSLAFSPDGRTLASASADTTVMLWNMTGRCDETGDKAGAGSDKEREQLWSDLDSADARKAFRAMARLSTQPKQTIALLRKHISPAAGQPFDVKAIEQRIADLDSEDFATREKAMRALEKSGPTVVPHLVKALQAKPALEKRRRLEKLMWTLRRARPPAELIRPLRAVELLERLGTADARQLLETLAGGTPDSPLTREAQAAFRRLSSLRSAQPRP